MRTYKVYIIFACFLVNPKIAETEQPLLNINNIENNENNAF